MPLKVTTEGIGLGACVEAFRELRHRLALDDGLSIIGVAIASVIILVSLIPAASLFTASTVTSVSGQARVIASNIATQVVEADRSLLANDFSGFEYQYWYLPNSGNPFAGTNPDPIPPGICTTGGSAGSPCLVQTAGLGEPFTVSQAISWVPSGSPTALEIDATVSWGVGPGAGSAVVSTKVAPPSWLMVNPKRVYTVSSCFPVPAGFPVSGQVQAFAVFSFQGLDTTNLANLGQFPVGNMSNAQFLLNQDAVFGGNQVDSISGVAFNSGSLSVYCPMSQISLSGG